MDIFLYSILTLVVATLAFWVYKLIRLHRSISTYRSYWLKRKDQPGDFVYVALGDSAAQAVGAKRPEDGYVASIAQKIERVTGRTVRVINLSVSGAKTHDLIDTQLPLLKGLKPDLVTLGIGGNDIKAYDSGVFEQNMKEILKHMPAQTVVADAPYFMHGKWMRDSKDMAEITTRLAHQHGLRVAKLYDEMEAEGWNAMWNAYAADWFHPNNRGYKTWFDAFWKQVKTTISKHTLQG